MEDRFRVDFWSLLIGLLVAFQTIQDDKEYSSSHKTNDGNCMHTRVVSYFPLAQASFLVVPMSVSIYHIILRTTNQVYDSIGCNFNKKMYSTAPFDTSHSDFLKS